MFYFVLKTKNANTNIILFSTLRLSLVLTGSFMSPKSSFLANSLSVLAILVGLRSAGFKYLTNHHLKHSSSSIFPILINLFLGWSNSPGNFVKLLPAKGLFYEILIV